jgi:hypothetical protein
MLSAPAVRSQILSRSTEVLGAIPSVDALFLSGSLVEGTADAYSDIDLRVVVQDHGYSDLLSRRSVLPCDWGPFLFHQTVGSNFTVSYFQSLTKVDVFYYKASDLHPSPWYTLGVMPLLDRTGLLREVVTRSATLRFQAPAPEMVSHAAAAVANLVEGSIRHRRGQGSYAIYLAAAAADQLCTLEDKLSGRAPIGLSKIELRSCSGLRNVLTQQAELSSTLANLATEARRLIAEVTALPEVDPKACAGIEAALVELKPLIESFANQSR